MSNNELGLLPGGPTHSPPKQGSWPRLLLLLLAALLLFGTGLAIGKSDSERVEVTPQSCLDALNAADEGFTLAADAMSAVSDIMTAVSTFDIAGVEQGNAELSRIEGLLTTVMDPYITSKEACRASAN